MAKAKKTETSREGATAKRTAPKAPRKTKKAAAAPAGSPLVDTTLAAQNAARILAAKAKLGAATAGGEANKESGSFKQLKESLNRPAAHTVSTALGSALGEHKSNLPNTGFGQVFHNQVQGGPRFNVPRRTSG